MQYAENEPTLPQDWKIDNKGCPSDYIVIFDQSG